jgi:hypothetical protein
MNPPNFLLDPAAALNARLVRVANRERRLRLWCKIAACWALWGLVAIILGVVERQSGWSIPFGGIAIAVAAVVHAVILMVCHSGEKSYLRQTAQRIEAAFPALNGRLITAVQQQHKPGQDLDYLQQRVVREALSAGDRDDWCEIISGWRMTAASAGQWLALLLLVVSLSRLPLPKGHTVLFTQRHESGVTVTPGDVSIERGNSLVVLARFGDRLPSSVDLVVTDRDGNSKRLPLAKSLADPVFGGSLPEVASDLTYRVDYSGEHTKDFHVRVFEYPRLERADIDVTYPEYTGLEHKRIEDTKRLSAVEGSKIDLNLQLNKPVVSAQLIPKGKSALPLPKGEGRSEGEQDVRQPGVPETDAGRVPPRGAHQAGDSASGLQALPDNAGAIPLVVHTNRAVADLAQFALLASKTYDLQLIDAEGRTNKVPAQFVFEALTNRIPEFHLASPRGDIRPSPLEEIPFEGTVWDDFGIKNYGIGYTIPGKDTKFIELGSGVKAKEKKPFQHTLRLEDLGVQPDELVAWFVWADDIGPDGQVRRSSGDLYFGEVRPFEEVFREGQGMDGQSQGGQQGQQQDRTGKLADLQKQIINATWKLQRQNVKQTPNSVKPDPRKQSSQVTPSSSPVLRSAFGEGGSSSTFTQSQTASSQRLPYVLPLPKGEGWGEGEEIVRHPTAPAMRFSRVNHQTILGLLADPPQDDSSPATPNPRPSSPRRPPTKSGSVPTYGDDATVVRDSQEDALKQAEDASRRQQDARAAALWSTAKKEMESALSRLEKATNSPAALPDALAAEQAAYQALLKLQQHEYQVMRNRNRSQGGGGSREQQMQRQLDQMDLTQSDNRYETQRQAQRPQNNERREQLQVQNRLQELARRQQDLNDRLKELQTALQEAKTEQEREEIRRRLKRLQEEEQQMLSDVDELRQRMDRPDNQSRMADERRQLDDTRNDIQRAAEAASQGSASQALASGTRAQRQLQEMRDQVRKANSSQFSDEMREMRSEARELARQQEELSKKMENDDTSQQKSLSGSPDRKAMLDQLAQQKNRMTNLVERATQLSQQAEEAEPLLSRQLYDSVRKFAQDTSKDVRETQDELLNRGLMTRTLYDRLKESTEPDGAKMLDITSELLRDDFLKQAAQSNQRSRGSIEDLKRGVERAAEGVLGDDTEALRLAQQELDRLTNELQKEMAGADGKGQTNRAVSGQSLAGNTNSRTNSAGQGSTPGELAQNNAERRGTGGTNESQVGRASSRAGGQSGRTNLQANASGRSGQNQEQAQNGSQNPGELASNSNQQQGDSNPSQSGRGQQPGQGQQQGQQPGQQPGEGQQGQGQQGQGQQGQGQQGQQQAQGQSGQGGQGQQAQSAQADGANSSSDGERAGEGANQNGRNTQLAQGTRNGGRRNSYGGGAAGGDEGGDISGSLNHDWNRIFDEQSTPFTGPITGDDFGPWSDRLRDVEEMVDVPELRNSIAVARERARLARQEYTRERKKPDWAVVQLQVMKPLLEVRSRIADELARRESNDALVPIDRDPVPNRYSDLVRRYYEELGKDR